MRIVNFNNHKTWTAWKKAYIDDLNIKITSLWNHLVYQNPPYIILNSVTSTNPVNLIQEGYCIEVESNNGLVNIFFPTHLQLHQGFYNDSIYGDALLGYWKNNYIYPISKNTFVQFNPTESNVQIESYDFPSGYGCIMNKLSAGKNDPENIYKRNIDNYLIYPLGNGSFFTLHTYQKDLLAKYRRNDMGAFINQAVINLSSSLRYFLHKPNNSNIDNSGSWTSLNYYEKDSDPYYIADIDNNLWTGGTDIVPEIYSNDNELIICDSKHQIIENTETKTLLYRLLVNTNISISDYARVELY